MDSIYVFSTHLTGYSYNIKYGLKKKQKQVLEGSENSRTFQEVLHGFRKF